MTDRVHSLTVVLAHDQRVDDVRKTVAAIEQIRGVISVTGNVADVESHVAEMRVRNEWREKLTKLL